MVVSAVIPCTHSFIHTCTTLVVYLLLANEIQNAVCSVTVVRIYIHYRQKMRMCKHPTVPNNFSVGSADSRTILFALALHLREGNELCVLWSVGE